MNSQLVYIHIPKTAGSSFRSLIIKNYPDDYYWWGVNEHTDNLDDYRFIGGHRHFPYYQAHPGNKLYISLIREPVARVISLYNYYINGPDKKETERWLDLGLNPDSLRISIEKCKEFRHLVTNHQCQYLCGKPNFDAVMSTIENNNFIIGCIDHIDMFTDYLGNLLEWPHSKLVYFDNRGANNYDKNYYFERTLVELIHEINQEDKYLYEFISSKGLYKNIQKNKLDIDSLKCSGKALCYSLSREACTQIKLSLATNCPTPLSSESNSVLELPLTIQNKSDEIIPATGKYPVRASYHWYNLKNELIAFEGIRTQLNRHIEPNESLDVALKVKFPAARGKYKLKIGLLQEKCCWFETQSPDHLLEVDVLVGSLDIKP